MEVRIFACVAVIFIAFKGERDDEGQVNSNKVQFPLPEFKFKKNTVIGHQREIEIVVVATNKSSTTT